MFAFNVAKRFLWNNKSQTLFIILGIAIGVSVQVFVGSLIQGLQKSLVDRTIGSSPHIIIESNSTDERIEDWQVILDELEKVDGLSYVVNTQDGNGFINDILMPRNGLNTTLTLNTPQVLLLRGFDLPEGNKIFKYTETLYNGTMPDEINEVIIGKETQIQYDLKIGDELFIAKGRPPYNITYRLIISGFYDLGVASLNRLWAITQNQTVAELFEFGSKISSINVQVTEVFAADVIAEQVKNLIGNQTEFYPSLQNITVTNWKAENTQLLSGLNGQTISSVMIQAFVIVSVVLGITSVLAITVLQKSKQLGILKAMGVDDGTAAKVFVYQGLLFGIGGAIMGVGLGLGLSWMFSTFAIDSATGEPIIALYLDYKFIAFSGILAIVACIIAAMVPAVRSKKLSVIEVIRNG
jgi:lipoprotein-releasing system permease protein